jgi:hypothetical protein
MITKDPVGKQNQAEIIKSLYSFQFDEKKYHTQIEKTRNPEEESKAKQEAMVDYIVLRNFMVPKLISLGNERGDTPFKDPKKEHEFRILEANLQSMGTFLKNNHELAQNVTSLIKQYIGAIRESSYGLEQAVALQDAKLAEDEQRKLNASDVSNKLEERIANLKQVAGNHAFNYLNNLTITKDGSFMFENIEEVSRRFDLVMIEVTRIRLQNEKGAIQTRAVEEERKAQIAREGEEQKEQEYEKFKYLLVDSSSLQTELQKKLSPEEAKKIKEQNYVKSLVIRGRLSAELIELKSRNNEKLTPIIKQLEENIDKINKWIEQNKFLIIRATKLDRYGYSRNIEFDELERIAYQINKIRERRILINKDTTLSLDQKIKIKDGLSDQEDQIEKAIGSEISTLMLDSNTFLEKSYISVIGQIARDEIEKQEEKVALQEADRLRALAEEQIEKNSNPQTVNTIAPSVENRFTSRELTEEEKIDRIYDSRNIEELINILEEKNSKGEYIIGNSIGSNKNDAGYIADLMRNRVAPNQITNQYGLRSVYLRLLQGK